MPPTPRPCLRLHLRLRMRSAGLHWEEFFYRKLVPWVHYVPVMHDGSDAKTIIQFLQRHDQIARVIGQNGPQKQGRVAMQTQSDALVALVACPGLTEAFQGPSGAGSQSPVGGHVETSTGGLLSHCLALLILAGWWCRPLVRRGASARARRVRLLGGPHTAVCGTAHLHPRAEPKLQAHQSAGIHAQQPHAEPGGAPRELVAPRRAPFPRLGSFAEGSPLEWVPHVTSPQCRSGAGGDTRGFMCAQQATSWRGHGRLWSR